MPQSTLTTTTPDGTTTTRPVPPSWASVAPLLQRWQMALWPNYDETWDLLSGWDPVGEARRVPFAALPQAIADLAAWCEAHETAEEGER